MTQLPESARVAPGRFSFNTEARRHGEEGARRSTFAVSTCSGMPDFPGWDNSKCDTGFQPVRATFESLASVICQRCRLMYGPEDRVTMGIHPDKKSGRQTRDGSWFRSWAIFRAEWRAEAVEIPWGEGIGFDSRTSIW